MTWERVCRDDELVRGRARTLHTASGPVAVIRAEDGVVYAVEDRCPHRGAALSLGVVYDVCKVACPDHGWSIDLRSGAVEAPEHGKVRTFPVETIDGEVFVGIDPVFTSELIASVSDGAVQLCNGGGCQLATQGEAFHVSAVDSEAVLIVAPPKSRGVQ